MHFDWDVLNLLDRTHYLVLSKIIDMFRHFPSKLNHMTTLIFWIMRFCVPAMMEYLIICIFPLIARNFVDNFEWPWPNNLHIYHMNVSISYHEAIYLWESRSMLIRIDFIMKITFLAEASFGLWVLSLPASACMCVCPSVCVCGNYELVLAITELVTRSS